MTRKPADEKVLVAAPIGFIRNEVKNPGMHDWSNVVSEVVVEPRFKEALDGLEEYSHIVVLFWMHRSSAGEHIAMKTHPQRRADLPLVGVFATRSPVRPNPVGMTIVNLIERDDNVLRVKGLDAINGTPVIDLKGFFPGDSIEDARVPDWVHKLRRVQDE